jgi:hypothetical protein
MNTPTATIGYTKFNPLDLLQIQNSFSYIEEHEFITFKIKTSHNKKKNYGT